jgi:hypothetical protein
MILLEFYIKHIYLINQRASVTWAHYAILLADRKQAAMGLWILFY